MQTIAYHNPGALGSPAKYIDIFEAYEDIGNNPTIELNTRAIQAKHKKGILEEFSTIPKKSYQEDKKQLLPAVTFSGAVDRSINAAFVHSGRLCIDIDEGNPEHVLRDFFKSKALKIPYIEAVARSISGYFNYHLWVNFLIEIPPNYNDIPPEVRKKARIKKASWIEDLHKAYFKVITTLLWRRYKILSGSVNDLKRVRYLSFDEDIKVNYEAEDFTLSLLEIAVNSPELKDKFRPPERRDKSKLNTPLNRLEMFKNAEQFANSKGYYYARGQKHFFRFYFAIACNAYGIEEEQTLSYVKTHFPSSGGGISNSVSGPYKLNKSDFGAWVKNPTF